MLTSSKENVAVHQNVRAYDAPHAEVFNFTTKRVRIKCARNIIYRGLAKISFSSLHGVAHRMGFKHGVAASMDPSVFITVAQTSS